MVAFKPLPFQYQQRGADLATAKPAQVSQFTEQRDQDLENYLAGLHGLPPGGTTGQVLTKESDDDYDADWETPGGGGSGVSPDYVEWSGQMFTLPNGADFVSASSPWDAATGTQSTAAGASLSANGALVLPGGLWQLNILLQMPEVGGAPTGPVVFLMSPDSDVIWPNTGQVPVLIGPGLWTAEIQESLAWNTFSGGALDVEVINNSGQDAWAVGGGMHVRISAIRLGDHLSVSAI